MQLLGIGADHGDARLRLEVRPGLVHVQAQRAGAEDDDEVVRRERGTHPPSPPVQVAGPQRVILREPGAVAEGLLPDRAAESLRERDRAGPTLGTVATGANDDRRRAGVLDQLRELGGRSWIRARGQHEALGGADGVGVRGFGPVPHRRDHERRAARGAGLVPGPGNRPGQILRSGRCAGPHRIAAGEAVEVAPGQKRSHRRVGAILLPDDDHQRRPRVARAGDRVAGMAKAGRRVQVDERGRPGRQCVTAGDSHHRALVQREHELEVGGQVGEEGDLGGSGIAEDPRHAVVAHDLEGAFADRRQVSHDRSSPARHRVRSARRRGPSARARCARHARAGP